MIVGNMANEKKQSGIDWGIRSREYSLMKPLQRGLICRKHPLDVVSSPRRRRLHSSNSSSVKPIHHSHRHHTELADDATLVP